MKNIILFATDDFGGAGKAALRIVKALNESGKICKMLVKNKTLNDNDVIKINAISSFSVDERIKNFINRRRSFNLKLDEKYYFGYKYDDIVYTDIVKFVDFVPDTIIITWITWFISPHTVRELASYYQAKIIICPMDMSLFTGGCHYAWECNGFKNSCENCPAILTVKHKYIAVNRLSEKKKNWVGENVEYWSFSSGVYSELINSSLAFNQKIYRFFIPIDNNVFNAKNRSTAKSVFDIPSDNKVILFGSNFSFEVRKGINYFIEAVNKLYDILSPQVRKKVKIVVAGRKTKGENAYQIPFDIIDIDFIKDELLLSHLYQASDVLVCPSIQDSGPMMINEAQMCGLPVIAFNIGVAPDFIENGFSGYICGVGDSDSMAAGIKKILLNEECSDNDGIANSASAKTSYSAFIASLKNR